MSVLIYSPMNKFIKTTLFLLLLLAGILAIGIYWTLYKPLPSYSKNIEISELTNDVDIHWDPYGTPYIYASNDADLYFTIGYLHAQERLWQMTLSQIAAEGRFAEYLGEEMVPYDIHQRTLGFWETAQRIESDAPDSLLTLLQHYSDGVNHFVDNNKQSLPLEFSLLGVDPIKWTVTHSIAITRLMAWDQNMHWWSELTYAYLADRMDPVQLRQLKPLYDDQNPVMLSDNTNSAAASIKPFLEKEIALRELLTKRGFPFGSNAWAAAGSKTASGLPILAGDPHMGLSIPGFWFELYQHTPDFQLGGATIPGSPFIILGQNRNMAWSMTNIMADDTDFFIEQVDSEDEDSYVSDSTSIPVTTQFFDERVEVIRVRDADDQIHIVRSSQNGPVISDIHPASELMNNRVVTMSWKGHDISQELWAVYKMNRATSMDAFRNAVELFETPGMNFIYADIDDNISIFTGASLPVRDHNPLLFRNGWDPSYQWQGSIPFDQLPHVVNPEKGYVSHANNKLHSDNYPYYISTFWEPPSRIIRINQLLESSDSLTTEYMQMMQSDVYSEHAREITEIIVPILRGSDTPNVFESAISYLENWDYEYHPNSTAASIMDLFFMNLTEKILLDELGVDAYQALIRLEHLPVMIVTRLLREDSSFFNIISTPETETRAEIVMSSMEETILQLEERFGPEPFEWRWENLHTLTLRPPLLGEAGEAPDSPFGFRMVVNNIFNRGPYPASGHGLTINKSQYSWHKPFETDLGPSIRRIVDFSNAGRSLSVIPTGQSGNPFSTNYGDQTNMWLEGRYRYVYQDSTFFQ
ncbi:MAG: penicillin acylase family protein, partial [Balneolaceae bacterium]